jgi:hypothetical protein
MVWFPDIPKTSYFPQHHRLARSIHMAKKTAASRKAKKRVSHPGMMGDGTEEQNLGQRGNPAARIKKKEVVAAFGKPRSKK